jgi:hypothetical protein
MTTPPGPPLKRRLAPASYRGAVSLARGPRPPRALDRLASLFRAGSLMRLLHRELAIPLARASLRRGRR